jgi:hypothetical protein
VRNKENKTSKEKKKKARKNKNTYEVHCGRSEFGSWRLWERLLCKKRRRYEEVTATSE